MINLYGSFRFRHLTKHDSTKRELKDADTILTPLLRFVRHHSDICLTFPVLLCEECVQKISIASPSNYGYFAFTCQVKCPSQSLLVYVLNAMHCL